MLGRPRSLYATFPSLEARIKAVREKVPTATGCAECGGEAKEDEDTEEAQPYTRTERSDPEAEADAKGCDCESTNA